MLGVRNQGIRKTELCKLLYPFGFYLHLCLLLFQRLAHTTMIRYLTAVVRARLPEKGAEMTFPPGAVKSGNSALSHHLWDSFSEEARHNGHLLWGRQ